MPPVGHDKKITLFIGGACAIMTILCSSVVVLHARFVYIRVNSVTIIFLNKCLFIYLRLYLVVVYIVIN